MSRAEGFAPIPTWMIRDASVSVYALTVYAALSSRSGLREIIPGRETLATEARCSVRQVARALVELEELGVVQRVRRKNKVGRASNGYALHPNGRLTVEDSQSSTSEVEDSDDRGSGLGEQGYGTGSAITPIRGRDREAEREEAESELAARLAWIWDRWPAPRRSTRKVVERSLRTALKSARWETIAQAAHEHTSVWSSWPSVEQQFVPLLSTWLNQERWTGAPPMARGGSAAPGANDRVRAGREMGARLQAEFDAQQRGLSA